MSTQQAEELTAARPQAQPGFLFLSLSSCPFAPSQGHRLLCVGHKLQDTEVPPAILCDHPA